MFTPPAPAPVPFHDTLPSVPPLPNAGRQFRCQEPVVLRRDRRRRMGDAIGELT
jgi:hypothetical protein